MNDPLPAQESRFQEILLKIVTYQYTLWEDRPVDLAELREKQVLSAADFEFMTANSVKYTPRRLSDKSAEAMLAMETASGAFLESVNQNASHTVCILSVADLESAIESLLESPHPAGEILLHIRLSEHDALALSVNDLGFAFQQPDWKQHLPQLKQVAAEFGLDPMQDSVDANGHHLLAFPTPLDSTLAAQLLRQLLQRGCGLSAHHMLKCVIKHEAYGETLKER